MNKAAAVVLAFVVSGCGGDPPSPGGQSSSMVTVVQGTWVATLNSSCAAGMTFDSVEATYVDQLICQLADGSFGTELVAGAANFSKPGEVTMTPKRASCPANVSGPTRAYYSVEGQNLTLGGDSGAVVFERVSAGGGGSVVVHFGCWTMGQFSAHPIQDL